MCMCVCEGRDPGSPVSYPVSPGTWELEAGRWGVAQKGNPGPGLLRRGKPVPRVVGTSWRLQEKPGGSGRAEGRPPGSFLQLFVKCSPLPISAGAQDVLQGVCPHPTPPDPGLSTLHCGQPCLPASLWDATHLEVSAHPHQTTHILRLEDLSPNATSSRSLPASCTHSFSPPDTVGLVLLCGAYHHISPLSDGRDPTSIPRPCPACPEPDSRTGVPDCWDQLAWLSSLN